MARQLRSMPLGDTDPFHPSRARPVRVRSRNMAADAHFDPHRHAWAQLAYCASGIVQVSAADAGSATARVTYIVPPSRAVWIAPGALHSVHVLEDAQFRTLYIDASVTPPGWTGCRVLVVSPLLRELVPALDVRRAPAARAREPCSRAWCWTRCAARPPSSWACRCRRRRPATSACARCARRCCARRPSAPRWRNGRRRRRQRAHHGAPVPRQLGTSYQQWRQQAVLAHALPLLARGMPVSHVAAASGYASDSAFTAMFKAAMGQPPSQFQSRSS
jgi:hypothetical protein